MGCCGSSNRDPEIEKTTNMDELVEVMKKKIIDLSEEKKLIEAHLADPKVEIKNVQYETDRAGLVKRVPYLDRLAQGYSEAIETMTTVPKLPFKESKEYMYDLVKHYFVAYDETNQYRLDLAEFKKFAFEFEQQQKTQ